jgi:hypothetical protein
VRPLLAVRQASRRIGRDALQRVAEGAPCALEDDGPAIDHETVVGWRAMWERGPNEATVVVESEARLLVMGHAQFRAVKAEATVRAA